MDRGGSLWFCGQESLRILSQFLPWYLIQFIDTPEGF